MGGKKKTARKTSLRKTWGYRGKGGEQRTVWREEGKGKSLLAGRKKEREKKCSFSPSWSERESRRPALLDQHDRDGG